MYKFRRLKSTNNERCIDIIKSEDGFFSLQLYILKYDQEEECYYEVRQLPDPSGKYGDINIAIKEAERLIKL